MRRIRHHDDDGVGFFRNLFAGFADDAACANKLLRHGPDVVKEQAMARGQKMAGHRTSHGAEANETDINHVDLPLSARSGVHGLHGVPSEAFGGGRPRLVFAANPATISDLVEISKQKRIVDLAGAGFIAAWIIRELDMRDTREMLLQGPRDIALHPLHMIDVVLDEEIFPSV